MVIFDLARLVSNFSPPDLASQVARVTGMAIAFFLFLRQENIDWEIKDNVKNYFQGFH
jgi:hypothetical protein